MKKKLLVYEKKKIEEFIRKVEGEKGNVFPVSYLTDKNVNLKYTGIKDKECFILDITALVMSLSERKDLQLIYESWINALNEENEDCIEYCVEKEYLFQACELFNYYFETDEVYVKKDVEEKTVSEEKSIVEYKKSEFDNLMENFEIQLYGHERFKKNLKKQLKAYILLHRMKRKKIESGEKDSTNKGEIGNLIQECYFGIPRNPSTEPDFPEAPLELKTFGYWDTARADQRLALSAIDYMDYQNKVSFEESHLYKKCHNMLFVIYLLQTGRLRIGSEIKYLRLYEFEKIVTSDMEQIKRDYYTITKKIREGKASELSEGDTEFLGAARRGDKNSKKQIAPKGDKALPRRFAFKQSYMSYLVREYIVPEKDFDTTIHTKKKYCRIKIPRGKSFEEWLKTIDEKWSGKTVRKIVASKSKTVNGLKTNGKAAFGRIGLSLLGIKSNADEYLMKTHTVVKSIRVNKNRQVKEKISFPTFEIADVINQEWEESEVFRYLSEQRFLLQIFVEEEHGYVYAGHLFLKFTPEQLDEWAKETWEDLKNKLLSGIQFTLEKRKKDVIIHSNIQGKIENQMGLIEVHGQSTYDIDRKHIVGVDEASEQYIDANTVNGRFVQREEKKATFGCELPNGDIIGKQSYWLNNDFILDYIKKHSDELEYNIAWEKK